MSSPAPPTSESLEPAGPDIEGLDILEDRREEGEARVAGIDERELAARQRGLEANDLAEEERVDDAHVRAPAAVHAVGAACLGDQGREGVVAVASDERVVEIGAADVEILDIARRRREDDGIGLVELGEDADARAVDGERGVVGPLVGRGVVAGELDRSPEGGRVDTVAAVDRVGAASAGDPVVAVAAIDTVGTRSAKERVGAAIAGDRRACQGGGTERDRLAGRGAGQAVPSSAEEGESGGLEALDRAVADQIAGRVEDLQPPDIGRIEAQRVALRADAGECVEVQAVPAGPAVQEPGAHRPDDEDIVVSAQAENGIGIAIRREEVAS